MFLYYTIIILRKNIENLFKGVDVFYIVVYFKYINIKNAKQPGTESPRNHDPYTFEEVPEQ